MTNSKETNKAVGEVLEELQDHSKQNGLSTQVLSGFDEESGKMAYNFLGRKNDVGQLVANVVYSLLVTDSQIRDSFIGTMTNLDGKISLEFLKEDYKKTDREDNGIDEVGKILAIAEDSIIKRTGATNLITLLSNADAEKVMASPMETVPVVGNTNGSPVVLAHMLHATILKMLQDNVEFKETWDYLEDQSEGE